MDVPQAWGGVARQAVENDEYTHMIPIMTVVSSSHVVVVCCCDSSEGTTSSGCNWPVSNGIT